MAGRHWTIARLALRKAHNRLSRTRFFDNDYRELMFTEGVFREPLRVGSESGVTQETRRGVSDQEISQVSNI